MRILVIDDDEHVARAIQRRLRDHDVVIENNGTNALALVKAASEDGNGFEVVICDFLMPGKNGLELLATLRRDPDRPILFLMSGYDDIDQAERVADAVLTKPFSVIEIVPAIERAKAQRALDTYSSSHKRGVVGGR